MLEKILNIIVFSGSAIAFLLAIGQLATKRPPVIKLITTFLFLNLTMMFIAAGSYLSGIIYTYTYLNIINISNQFFTGPLIYIYFSYILKKKSLISIKKYVHFIPGIIVLIILITVYIESPDTKISFLNNNISFWDTSLFNISIHILYPIVTMYILLYIVLFFILSKDLWNKKSFQSKPLILHLFIFIIVTCLIIAIAFVGELIRIIDITRFSNVLMVFLLVWGFLIGQRYPEMFFSLKEEAEKIRYERSHLKGIDVDMLLKKLNRLMVEDKIFSDEDLNLPRLAGLLDLSIHQISELLNDRIEKKFNEFINEFRISEAKKLLIDDAERPILAIAYSVGFNSQSSFYASFLHQTGQTPGKFRKQNTIN